GLGRWSEQAVIDFLRSGRNQHGVVFGTMTEVVNASTQHLTDSDLAAIAKYLKSLSPTSSARQGDYVYDDKTTAELRAGAGGTAASLYVRHCESCHMRDGRGQPALHSSAGRQSGATRPRPLVADQHRAQRLLTHRGGRRSRHLPDVAVPCPAHRPR